MKRILLAFLVLTGVAEADQAAPPIPGTAPAGWKQHRDHAAVVHEGVLSGLPAGVASASARVHSFASPERGGQLIFTVVDAGMADDAAAAAFIRERLDDLKTTPDMMVKDGGGKARSIDWREATDDQTRVVESFLEWAHETNGTHSIVRAGWVKLPGTPDGAPIIVEEVRAECVLAADKVEALRPVCGEALASMMLPEAAARLPISAQAAPPAPVTTAKEPPPSMTATPPGTPVPMKPVVEKTPERDWRPFYVLGGLLLLGGFLIWNRRRREEYDEEAEEKRDEADAHEREEDQ